MRRTVYLDYNATQPLRPTARAAMLAAIDDPANASSIHGFGQRARHTIEHARGQVASLIDADPARLTFVSGATEANATALAGFAAPLVSAIEHPSVRTVGGATTIPVDQSGVIDLAALARLLDGAAKPALISLMLVNNETGVIQPVAEAANLAHAHGALIHCDAAQALGRIPISADRLGVDLMTLSSHKIGGPLGAGALYVRDGVEVPTLIRGGGQEGGRRGGTENVAAIAGFGAAAAEIAATPDEAQRIAALRDRMERELRIRAPDLVVHGADAPRVGNTSCFGGPGLPAETALIALDLEGIAVSSGAACSSGAVEPSRVLLAMGVPEERAREAIRVSLGWATTPDDIEIFVESWAMVYRRVRSTHIARSAKTIREHSG